MAEARNTSRVAAEGRFVATAQDAAETRFRAWLAANEAEQIPDWSIELFRSAHQDGMAFGLQLMKAMRDPLS